MLRIGPISVTPGKLGSGFGFLCRLTPVVTMVQACQAWQRNQSAMSTWPMLDRSAIGPVLVQAIVNYGLVPTVIYLKFPRRSS
jgi:hypothetical protein